MAETTETTEKSQAPPKLKSLHGMRFVAALLVFAFHGAISFVFSDETVGGIYIWLTSGASAAVAFFFVLSGFVLTWSYRPDLSTPRFLRRRLMRIVPVHVVTWAVAIVSLVAFGAEVGFWQSLSNLFLLQAWIPDNSFLDSANGVSWSLSVDLLYYLTFPALIFLARKIRENLLWLAVIATIALVILMPLVSKTFLPDTPAWSWGKGASWTQIWFVYLFPPVRLLEFFVGMLLARIVMTGRWIGFPLAGAAVLTAIGYVLTTLSPWSFLYNYAASMIIPIALLVPAAAAADIKGRKTWVNGRKMFFLGDLTFSFYLVHDLVLKNAHRAFGVEVGPYGGLAGPTWSTPVAVLFLAGAFAASLGVAYLTYRFVEVPAMNRWSVSKAEKQERAAARAAKAAPEPQPV
ncbi:acyltransferase family protein [Lentzea cavernae]|uniref:Acyltransferase n=1 Tax=Lentzea cavernae TaxID=2020703 RepID=A0ABQ3MNM8_9PSEU|nr:acyltransferase [Lentzea cavernae]GHH52473.1 acyltransferase [Lentzea cavernae]